MTADEQPAAKPRLNDPNVYPDVHVLRHELGDAFKAYKLWCETIASEEFGIDIEWRHYKDGGAWLCKATRRKKTVCWLSVWQGYFKLGFYFTDRNADGIENLDIDPDKKAEFKNAPYSGKLKPLGFEIRDASALADAKVVMKYKISVLR